MKCISFIISSSGINEMRFSVQTLNKIMFFIIVAVLSVSF